MQKQRCADHEGYTRGPAKVRGGPLVGPLSLDLLSRDLVEHSVRARLRSAFEFVPGYSKEGLDSFCCFDDCWMERLTHGYFTC